MFNEIKLFLRNDTVFYTLVIMGVAIASFGLGRLSVEQMQVKQPTAGALPLQASAITSPKATTSALEQRLQESTVSSASSTQAATEFIASKSGTKYHYSWCPGAKQIKEENKIIFNSTDAARAAGYTPAANCPGLE
jgi:uncharacterized membrane protein